MGAWNGMLVVETIAKIRRAYFVQGPGRPIKAICPEGFAEGCSEGSAVGGDGVPL